MERILENCARIFDRSTRPFGIAQVHLDDAGNPADVTIEYLNAAMAATAESRPDDLRGKNVYEIWPDGDRTWLDYYYRAACLGEAVEFETVSVAYRTFQHVAIFPIAEGYCGYEVQDITSWLTHSHPALENVSAGLFFYEARTGLLLLTDPAQECCGLEKGYMSLKEFVEQLFNDADAERIYEVIAGFSAGSRDVLCEERLRNGRWIRLSMSNADQTARFATGFMEDITLLKETEEKSARRSKIIESLGSEYYALYIIDLIEDRISPYLLRNEVAEYFAKDVVEATSYSAWIKAYCDRYVAEEDKQKVLMQLGPASLRAGMSDGAQDLALVCKRLFGDEEQYIELRVIKLAGEEGRAVLAACNINEDVEKRMVQNEALQSALTLARHASEAKTTFLTNISHDFRTPLNSIMGFTHLALAHAGEEDRVRSSLEKIMVSSEHLLELINQVLDVSRIESGKVVLNEQSLNLTQLAEDIRSVFSAQAAERQISFNVDASAIQHPAVLGDQLRINQILVNTVGNALKYTDRGGRVDVIVAEGPVSPNGVVMFDIVVRDTGCGMSEDFIERIFMPFERDDVGGARSAEGTGLGMTITKNLIDLLGGTITVKSKPGRGSEFAITLPLRLDDGCAAMQEDGDKDPARASFDGLHALVTDDDELSREMMAEILQDHGFTVDQASDGDEALDAIEESAEGTFDVVLLDMRMPKMPGDVAARAIRLLHRADVADLPIIAVTADAFEEVHRRSREAGMTAHITKPLDTRQLLAVLGECLGR